MKIGQFAKKYNINITAVRYYVEKALLTPERKNGQYIFNDSCERDMEKILKYKDYRLSLDEIELLFFLEKTSKLKDQTILEIISEVFADKKRMLEEEIVALQGIVKKLDEEAKCFKTARIAETPNTVNGIPFSFIPYLYCPKCGKPLVLDSVSIANNKISKGEIGCGCVDVYIDDFSITNCIFVYNRSIYGSISPLMKHKGRVIGIFVDYEAAPNSLENFKKDLPNFKPEKMKLKTIKADLELNSMTMSETRTIGKTTGDEQHFPRNVVSEQVPILGYKAVKK